MPGPSSDASKPAPEPPVKATGESVPEPKPATSPTETTVKVAMPPALPDEDTVRTTPPTPSADAAGEELEEIEAVEEDSSPSLDVKALVHELEAVSRDVPVSRSDMPTVPETAAKKPRREVKPRRDDPPAVAGEVGVAEKAPPDLFGSAPATPTSREQRERPRRKRPVDRSRRDDPPSVAGEVAVQSSNDDEPEVVPRSADIVVAPMTSSGPQPVMSPPASQPQLAASGSHPIYVGQPPGGPMASSGSHPVVGAMNQSGAVPVMGSRVSSDPSGFMVSGPQPRTRSSSKASRTSARDSILLWGLAGALVVLALGVVLVMVTLMD